MTAPPGNVLHVVDSLGFGGTQTILKGLFESRVDDPAVHLYVMRAVTKQMEIAHPNVATSRSTLRFSTGPLLDLRTIVRKRAIGVLHCHLFRAQVFGFLLKGLFFPRIALIFHEHGRVVGREGGSGLEALMFRWFLRLAWRRVDHFICISEHTRSRLLQLIPEVDPRTTVVANPIPVHPGKGETQDREAIRRAQAIPDGAFVVGFASRLVEGKGWRDFLHAISLLAPKLPVFFLLAGDGEDREKAEARIRELGLERRGRMLGHIDWMKQFYGCLDCFIMPSHCEAHGLSHLEAQSFGVPVVVSSVPGLRATVVEDADALLFEPGDASALADCIRRLADDSAMRERLISGGLANSARYAMDAFAARLTEIHAFAVGSGVSHTSDSRRLLVHNATAHDQVAGFYDRKHVEIFNSVEQERLANTVDEVLHLTGLPAPRMLDVGAGTGNLSLKFLAAGCRVCAADVSMRSLEQLARKAPEGAPISTCLLTDDRLPFPDASFDIVGAYSVLHHIPDYLFAVREMIRVLRPGGFLYIDHESSDRAWLNDSVLEEYLALTKLSPWEHLRDLVRTGEAFTFAFAKTVLMKAFVNRRYEREGDIHVWPDDHIEWKKVGAVLAQAGAPFVRTQEYLQFRPRGNQPLYDRYRDRCSDMQYIIARKHG